MFDFLRNIPETVKGIGLVLFGAILVLHAFGIFKQRLDLIIIVAGAIIMLYGFIILNGPKRVTKMVEDLTKKKDDSSI